MVSSSSDNFKKMFEPEHPHRKLHIAVSVLAVVAIVVYVIYQFNKSSTPVSISPPSLTADELKMEQLRSSQNNQIVELSPEEIKIKEAQLKASEKNPIVKMTPEEIAQKKLQLSQ